jgi:hypothetical protein
MQTSRFRSLLQRERINSSCFPDSDFKVSQCMHSERNITLCSARYELRRLQMRPIRLRITQRSGSQSSHYRLSISHHLRRTEAIYRHPNELATSRSPPIYTKCFGHAQRPAFLPSVVFASRVSGAIPFSTQSMSAASPSPGYQPSPPPQ